MAVSELIRRTLIAALTSDDAPSGGDDLTTADVERIARRIVREELDTYDIS